MQRILIATSNEGKVREFRRMLQGTPFEVLGLTDLPSTVEVGETGATFPENARLKASGYALQTGLPALADDSGLEIDALDGRPGVLSARYGGDHTSFDEKMLMILDELNGVPDPADRSARFCCSLAIADESGLPVFEADGICPGRIAASPRGIGGFGYDPIFIPAGFEFTFGELDGAVKRQISHRAAAFGQILSFLRHYQTV